MRRVSRALLEFRRLVLTIVVACGETGLADTAFDILRRCHDSDGVIWFCKRKATDEVIWFFPSGRKYPTDERRPAISSTTIRKYLNQTPQDEVYKLIKDLAMNAKELLITLDFTECPLEVGSQIYSAVHVGDCDLMESGVLVEAVEAAASPLLQEAKQNIMELARQAVYCGPVVVRGETKDDVVLFLADEADGVGSKRRPSI